MTSDSSGKDIAIAQVRESEGSADAEICSGCEQPLTRRGPGGECLRCLMGFAFSPDPDAEAADDLRRARTSGALRYGHFEIMLAADGSPVELGCGAMGVTYRARDTVLGSEVALKVIDHRLADDAQARARFLREARAAAQLHHPNVASVTHYGEQEGECYYVMELVEGDTLEELVRREGCLSTDAALPIVTQVTHALAAAEMQGLVHRDLKPSNIMLVAAQQTGRAVKVIDFGLAKAVDPTSGIGENETRQGFVGTPTYASPEQFSRSEDRRVDTRSDIYSLGATLWYLLCGRTPFLGNTLEEIHSKQVNRALPVEQLTAKHVSASVVALLRSMLAVDPDDRPQSARELLEQLQRCRERLALARRWKKARRWLAAAAVLGLTLLGLFSVRELMQRERVSQAAADRSIAVLPFENLSPDPADAFFATGMQDEITSELAMIAQLKVIGADSARGYGPGRRDLAQIGRELGVGHLLEGTVRRSGGQARVTVTLIDLRDRARDWRNEYERPVSDVFAVQREITGDVANSLRATLSAREKSLLAERPTTDAVAYDLYLRSRQGPTLHSGPVELRRALRTRLALLEEAVSRDPNFLFAYCEIAEVHAELDFEKAEASPEERAIDHRALAEAALHKARSLNPTHGRVHLAQANHLHMNVRDHAQARVELELARRTLPNNARLEDLTAMVSRVEGRWDDAVRAANRAAELQPRDAAILDNLVIINRALRRYEEADRASERLLAVKREDERFFARLLRAAGPLEQRADLNPLREAIAAASPKNDREAAHLHRFRVLYALCSREPDEVARALAADPRPRINPYGFVYSRAWFEGLAARMRGDREAAHAAFGVARSEMHDLVDRSPGAARLISQLALIDAGLGRKEEAVRGGQRACELMPVKKSAMVGPGVAVNLAAVYAWTDQPDQALALLDELVNGAASVSLMFQPSYGDLRLNPIWDPLRHDSRFEAIVGRLAPAPPR
jgi:serine/threonine-protein kinase